jgi:hypothetical protein
MQSYVINLSRLVALMVALPALASSSDVVRTEHAEQLNNGEAVVASISRVEPTPKELQGSSSDGVGDAANNNEWLPRREPHGGVDENMFDSHRWYTPPPPPQKRMVAKPPERKPVAPPLPFELLGTFEQAGSPTVYFLVRGDRIFEVAPGDTLEGTYSVDGISNGQLMFTYLPLSTSQGLRLGEK